MIYKEKLNKLRELIDIQHCDGNYNYNEYQYGLLNGLIVANKVFTENEEIFPPQPKKFIKHRGYNEWALFGWWLIGLINGLTIADFIYNIL